MFSRPVLIGRGLGFNKSLVLALECSEGPLDLRIRRPILDNKISVAIAAGSHPFPSRTRKLRLPAPMVLGGRPPGRVGRRRISRSNAPGSVQGCSSFSGRTPVSRAVGLSFMPTGPRPRPRPGSSSRSASSARARSGEGTRRTNDRATGGHASSGGAASDRGPNDRRSKGPTSISRTSAAGRSTGRTSGGRTSWPDVDGRTVGLEFLCPTSDLQPLRHPFAGCSFVVWRPRHGRSVGPSSDERPARRAVIHRLDGQQAVAHREVDRRAPERSVRSGQSPPPTSARRRSRRDRWPPPVRCPRPSASRAHGPNHGRPTPGTTTVRSARSHSRPQHVAGPALPSLMAPSRGRVAETRHDSTHSGSRRGHTARLMHAPLPVMPSVSRRRRRPSSEIGIETLCGWFNLC